VEGREEREAKEGDWVRGIRGIRGIPECKSWLQPYIVVMIIIITIVIIILNSHQIVIMANIEIRNKHSCTNVAKTVPVNNFICSIY